MTSSVKILQQLVADLTKCNLSLSTRLDEVEVENKNLKKENSRLKLDNFDTTLLLEGLSTPTPRLVDNEDTDDEDETQIMTEDDDEDLDIIIGQDIVLVDPAPPMIGSPTLSTTSTVEFNDMDNEAPPEPLITERQNSRLDAVLVELLDHKFKKYRYKKTNIDDVRSTHFVHWLYVEDIVYDGNGSHPYDTKERCVVRDQPPWICRLSVKPVIGVKGQPKTGCSVDYLRGLLKDNKIAGRSRFNKFQMITALCKLE